jgi:outer membrane protein assembly factor BamB
MRPTVLFAVLVMFAPQALADDWPRWGGPRGDLIWREPGVAMKLPEPNADGLLPRVWSVPIKEGYSGPAVANGRVWVTDRDARADTERVLCLDAETGREMWKHEYPARYTVSYPAGPRATPLIDSGRVYTIGAMGDFFCFDEKTGEVLWQKNFPKDFGTELAIWGQVAPPLVDGEQLIALVGGTDGALVVSFDKATGKELWRSLEDDQVGYCPPQIFEFGGRRQLIVWHPKAISSLDPTTGRVIWEIPWNIQAGLTIPMPRQVGKDRLFLTAFYNGPKMLEVGATGARVVWEGDSDSEIQTDKLHSIMPTPAIDDGHIYGVCSYGQLRCLSAADGERVWETYEATGQGRWWNAFLIPYEPRGDTYFLHNEQGDLIIAELTPKGYKEIDRGKLVEPTRRVQRRMTIWSHPAFADRSVFARNDKEIVRVDLSAEASR